MYKLLRFQELNLLHFLHIKQCQYFHSSHNSLGNLPRIYKLNRHLNGLWKSGQIDEARRMFDRMSERDEFTWNTMVAAYAHSGRLAEAKQLFDEAPKKCSITWSSLISGFCRYGCESEGFAIKGEQLHALVIKTRFDSNAFVNTGLVDMYAKCDSIVKAKMIFDEMPERKSHVLWTAMITGYSHNNDEIRAIRCFRDMRAEGVEPNQYTFPSLLTACAAVLARGFGGARRALKSVEGNDVVSWNSMVVGCVRQGLEEEALLLFKKMHAKDMDIDDFMYPSVLNSCASMKDMESAKSVHCLIVKTGYEAYKLVSNALVDVYAKGEELGSAFQVFNSMIYRDVVSWTSLVTGYAYNGSYEEALKLFCHLRSACVDPDQIVIASVLSACAELTVLEFGQQVHTNFVKFSFRSTLSVDNSLVTMYAKCGCIKDAKKVFNLMKIRDVITWTALIIGYAKNVGFWENTAKIRRLMKLRGISKEPRCSWMEVNSKEPGCSWMEVNSKVHKFMSEDRSHVKTDQIYSKIDEIMMLIKEAGYVPNMNFALHDVDEEGKELGLAYHSEMLAVAFGLLFVPQGAPIRIFKNLRVCGDCHAAMKFISRVFNQHTILRDSNCFHHFREGTCSCGDYWLGLPQVGLRFPCGVYARRLTFRVNDCACLDASMVVCAPFVRWDKITHGSDGSARAGVYYLETAQGERVICAVAIPCEGNRMTYRPFDSFLEDYRALLPSGSGSEWNFRFQLAAWLDGIVYYSFLRYSQEGIGSCWHFSSVSLDVVAQPGYYLQRLPVGLRRHFLPSGPPMWILVVHGYRIWPIEVIDQRFGDGWDKFRAVHQLKADFKVIFACERKWIFHTVILDENDREVWFHWSGQNMHRRQLHPPRALRTSCLPSLVSHGGRVLKFGYLHVPIVQPRLEFEARLKEAFCEFHLDEMVIKMGDYVWNIPINNLQLDVHVFDQFLSALDLSCLDFLLVLMLSTMEFRVVVFPMDYDIDIIYSWF
ncbi:hypothetical protein RHGRI_001579 [Rhododendron griersonianum]|uniref:DYW domain-containing protein n=1 Tax=Rhododendron griersonianum TaxID=479676 RepID=A0AAV6LMV1_9ERIC|nr:hypothetical protein RHGRI_001579 [Rhododendron griersonianum]